MANYTPPADAVFNSKEDALEFLYGWEKNQMYVPVILRSQKEKYVQLICDMGGTYRNKYGLTSETRRRPNVRSRLTRCEGEEPCPWGARITRSKEGGWLLSVRRGEHNHVSKSLHNHPKARRLTQEQREIVKTMKEAAFSPREIYARLLGDCPGALVTRRDIYNEIARLKRIDSEIGDKKLHAESMQVHGVQLAPNGSIIKNRLDLLASTIEEWSARDQIAAVETLEGMLCRPHVQSAGDMALSPVFQTSGAAPSPGTRASPDFSSLSGHGQTDTELDSSRCRLCRAFDQGSKTCIHKTGALDPALGS
jgi:hypothetical protein